MKDQRIALLFGAGLSIPSGMPSTQDITDVILSGEGIVKTSEGKYLFEEDKSFSWVPEGIGLNKQEYIHPIITFLTRIKEKVEAGIIEGEKTNLNYEDVFYIVDQVYASLRGEENYIITPFVRSIEEGLKEHSLSEYYKETINLASAAERYIRDIVRACLDPKCNVLCGRSFSTKHFEFIEEFTQKDDFRYVDIFTLNHDTLLEGFLNQMNLPFTDGFGCRKDGNGARRWQPALFEDDTQKNRLFKLHGSIDWEVYSELDNGFERQRIGIRGEEYWQGGDGWEKKSEREVLEDADNPSRFLIGTYNKMDEYQDKVFTVLQYHFIKSLENTNRLLVVGYSFGDKGINRRIIEWMNEEKGNRMIIVDPCIDNLMLNSRGEIKRNWEEWKNNNRLMAISKGIEKVGYQEIISKLRLG